jgi:hypothetical protein
MKKTAPTLREHVRNLAAWGKEDGTACREDRELKALLAVARAAEKMGFDGDCPAGTGCNQCDLARALSRLDKVSHD